MLNGEIRFRASRKDRARLAKLMVHYERTASAMLRMLVARAAARLERLKHPPEVPRAK
jgi:hypothetical protein